MNNYHTHTFRCRHAEGDIDDYVRRAISANMAELGFSDHVALPDERWSDMRMGQSEVGDYLSAIAEARRVHGKAIRILSGFEAEWIPEYEHYYRDEYLGKRGMDYLAAGIHYFRFRGEWEDGFSLRTPAMLVAFASQTQKALASGLFSFLAHPDMFCYSWFPWDANAVACARDILSAAEDTGVPLEINGYGLRKPKIGPPGGRRPPYPHREFWRLATAYRIRVLVNSDAHRPADVAAKLEEGRALAAEFGLEIIETLDPGVLHP
jgi:histidinol-phosphatase (PHP family)